jgi:hypothetical protein
VLDKVARFYNREVEDRRRADSLIEPLMIAMIGGAVGARYRLYLPMFNIINLIKARIPGTVGPRPGGAVSGSVERATPVVLR